MLGKLIKHDFRALSRTLFPLQIGVLAGGLLATLLSAIASRATVFDGAASMSEGAAVLRSLIESVSIMLSVLILVAIAASAFVTLVFICVRFYKHFLGDEGYLTFTLPVSTGRLICSKLITGMIWLAINLLAILVTALIFAVFGTAGDRGLINYEVLSAIGNSVSAAYQEASRYVNVPLVIAFCAAVMTISTAAQMMQIYFAILVGGQSAKKHRVLAAIGMYLLINMGVGTMATMFYSTVINATDGWYFVIETVEDTFRLVLSALGWSALLYAGLFTLFFLASRSIMRKHLNLQ